LRASSQAMASPNGSATAVATSAIRSDSSTAVHSSGVRLNIRGSASGTPGDRVQQRHHEVGLIRKVKPYFSKMLFAAFERSNSRYLAVSGLAVAVKATG
jgi:hypothetical protein